MDYKYTEVEPQKYFQNEKWKKMREELGKSRHWNWYLVLY